MITVKTDKDCEFKWIKEIIETGIINMPVDRKDYFKQLGIGPKQPVTFDKPKELASYAELKNKYFSNDSVEVD